MKLNTLSNILKIFRLFLWESGWRVAELLKCVVLMFDTIIGYVCQEFYHTLDVSAKYHFNCKILPHEYEDEIIW